MFPLIGTAPSRTFPGNWHDAVKFSAKHGFDAVELKYEVPFTLPDHLDGTVMAAAGERVHSDGLFLSLHGPYANIGNLIDCRYEAAVAEHLEAIEVAKKLGARTYTIHGGWVEQAYSTDDLFTECRARVLHALERILSVAGPVKICLENQNNAESAKHKTNCLVPDLHWFGSRLPQLCYTFDVGHANVTTLTPDEFLRQLGPERIGLAHVHDNDGKTDQHRSLADGTTDWNAFVDTYLDLDSQFPLMFELGAPDDLLTSQRILGEIFGAKGTGD
jgi:sugar phosphate isomerase/epimerase